MTGQAPARGGRALVVGLFEREAAARSVIDALRSLGFSDQQYGLLAPGQSLSLSDRSSANIGPLFTAARSGLADGQQTDLASVLASMGVPEGEARFYAEQAREGRTVVIIRAESRSDEVRQLILDHGGYDVQSRGAEFIRGDGSGTRQDGAGVPGGLGPRPIDLTNNWDDFRSRYEMLWQQHYGTTDATWEQMEPVYRYAWQLANDARYRGRPWSEVEADIEREWRSSTLSRDMSWSDASGPVRDVWEDVAQEALTGAEGGADRRIPTSGTDQSVAARDVVPPRQGAA